MKALKLLLLSSITIFLSSCAALDKVMNQIEEPLFNITLGTDEAQQNNNLSTPAPQNQHQVHQPLPSYNLTNAPW